MATGLLRIKRKPVSVYIKALFFFLISCHTLASTGTDKSKQEMDNAFNQSTLPATHKTMASPLVRSRPKTIPISAEPFLDFLIQMPERLMVRVLFRDYFDEFYPLQQKQGFRLPIELPEAMLHKCYQARLIWRMALLLAVKIGEQKRSLEPYELAGYFWNFAFQVNRILRARESADLQAVSLMPQLSSDFSIILIPALPGSDIPGKEPLMRKERFYSQVQLGTNSAELYAAGFDRNKKLFELMQVVNEGIRGWIEYAKTQPLAELVTRKFGRGNDRNEKSLKIWRLDEKVEIDSAWLDSGCRSDEGVSTFLQSEPQKIMKLYLCHKELVSNALYTIIYQVIDDVFFSKKPVLDALAVMRRDYLLMVCPMSERDVETLDVLTVVMSMFLSGGVPLFIDQPFVTLKLKHYADVTSLCEQMTLEYKLYRKLAAVGADPACMDQQVITWKGEMTTRHVVTLAVKEKSPALEQALVVQENSIFSELISMIAYYFNSYQPKATGRQQSLLYDRT
ncbi:hypothetical protein ACWJJH_21045 [Endozoicomonadaceae bacterium StTr2]